MIYVRSIASRTDRTKIGRRELELDCVLYYLPRNGPNATLYTGSKSPRSIPN